MLLTGRPALGIGEQRSRHMGAGHLPALDGLRGLAILAVMASHLFQVNYEGKALVVRLLGTAFYYGWMGVDLFFVLSGFLITGILVDSREDPQFFRKFYMRRILRIFPLYYGSLLLLALLTPVLHMQWHGLGWPLTLYLQNLMRYYPLTQQTGPNVSLNHLWSLAIEEQFYLVWPLLVFLARTRRRVLVLACAGSVLALLWRVYLIAVQHNGFTTHFSMCARADALLLGGVVAMLYRGDHWPRALGLAPWLAVFAGGFVAFTLVRADEALFRAPVWIYAVRYSVVALASVGLLIWALRAGGWSWTLQRRTLRWIGKYSYGLYILHMMFLPLLSRTLRNGFERLLPSKMFAVFATAMTVFALSCLAAWLSFHFFEKQFLRLKRYFDYSPRGTSV